MYINLCNDTVLVFILCHNHSIIYISSRHFDKKMHALQKVVFKGNIDIAIC